MTPVTSAGRPERAQSGRLNLFTQITSSLTRRSAQLVLTNNLRSAVKYHICALPNFARACGRVSVGGHPDKRPDSRPRALLLSITNRQPEAKPAYFALSGGRDLKQRRTGFFGLVGPPKVSTEEACFSLPGVRSGDTLSNPRQHRRVKNPSASFVSPSHEGEMILTR